MKTKNIKRKKYLTGGKVNTYVEDPTTEMAKNAIMLAQAQQEASSNPLVQGLNVVSGLAGTFGNMFMGMEGDTGIKLPKLANGGKVTRSFVNDINKRSKANFVSRLLDPNRGTIPDWQTQGQIATHKMSWATDDKGNAIVFPMIQEIDGNLHDFTDPKNKHGKWDGYKSAVERGDTLMMSPKEAEAFTTQYKNFYPAFDKYGNGGTIKINPANKGKFNATKKATGKTTEELTHSKNPLTRKRAIFAQNASKWNKKALGGPVSQVPVEVEGGEVAETPFGNLLGFNGPNHDRGGIKTSLTPGTEVYSKRIKIDGKTMADRKLSRERREKRFQKLSDRGDSIGRNTLNRVKTINLSQDEADKKVQDFYSLMDSVNAIQKFPGGGEVKPLTLAEVKKKLKYTPGKDTGYTAEELDGIFKPEEKKPIPFFKHADGTPMTNSEMQEVITGVSHDYKKTHNVEDYSPDAIKYNNFKAKKSPIDLNLIPGDLLGMAGNLYQAFAPLNNTMANRASDTPNINPYKGFGDDALKANDQAKTYAQRMLDSQLQDLESSSLSARRTSRNSAMGVNTQRALDLAIESNKEKATRGIYDSFTNQMLGLFNAQSQLENQQDTYQMQGKAAQDLADRQDKDNFYSQLGIDKTSVGRGIAETGKALNQTRTNDAIENLLNSMFRYTSVDGSTGKLVGKKDSKAAVAALASGDWINLNNPDTGKPFKTGREFAKYYNLKEKK